MKTLDHKKVRPWLRAGQVLFVVLILLFLALVALAGNNASLAGEPTNSGALDFPALIESMRGMVSWLIGTLAVVMTISGGIVYATSQGNPNQMGVGRDLIISAISGLALYAFSTFLLGSAAGGGGIIKTLFGGW